MMSGDIDQAWMQVWSSPFLLEGSIIQLQYLKAEQLQNLMHPERLDRRVYSSW